MSLETWLIFAFAAATMSVTPGPTGLLYLSHGLQYGAVRSIATLLGGCLGFTLLINLSLAGMGALLMASETAFQIAKWLGAAYLVYLGIKAWRAPVTAAADDIVSDQGYSNWQLFLRGFLVATSNPKAVIFFAAFLPQFIDPAKPWLNQVVILCLTIVLIELVYGMLLCRTAQRISPWLNRRMGWFNRLTGAAFVGLGGALSLAKRL